MDTRLVSGPERRTFVADLLFGAVASPNRRPMWMLRFSSIDGRTVLSLPLAFASSLEQLSDEDLEQILRDSLAVSKLVRRDED